MKLVFVNRYFHPDHSATSQLLSDLAFALAERGRTVHVVTSRRRYDDARAELTAAERVRGVQVHRVWTSRFGRHRLPGRALDYLTFYLAAGWRLFRLVRARDVIVAKTDPPLISVVAMVVARLRGARLVNWLQDLFPEVAVTLRVGTVQRARGLLQPLRDASLRAAFASVVPGERMAGYLDGRVVPAERIAVIPNWADSRALEPVAAAQNPLRRAWGLDGRFVVGYSGNMGRAHDFTTLLAAAERLAGEPGIAFLLIGDGYYRLQMEREARRRALGNVFFKPYQPQSLLSQSLGVADVHLVSLRPEMEGFVVPSKFYGAAAAGRPVVFVGDRDGELARTLRAARCGVTVGVGEGEALAACLLRLYRSPALCARLGENARRALVSRFDRERAIAAWCALLRRIPAA